MVEDVGRVTGSHASHGAAEASPPNGFDPARKKKRPRPAKDYCYGILNPYGDMWTHKTFQSPREAAKYVINFWRGVGKGSEPDRKYRIVPVEVRVRPLDEPEWLTLPQAIATEARRAETTGSVHEGADPKGIAQTTPNNSGDQDHD